MSGEYGALIWPVQHVVFAVFAVVSVPPRIPCPWLFKGFAKIGALIITYYIILGVPDYNYGVIDSHY